MADRRTDTLGVSAAAMSQATTPNRSFPPLPPTPVVTVEPNRTSITALPKILPATIWARTEVAYVYNPTCFSSNAWFRDLPSKAWTSTTLPGDPGAAPLAAIAADEAYSTRLYGAAGAVLCDIVASMAWGARNLISTQARSTHRHCGSSGPTSCLHNSAIHSGSSAAAP